MEGALTQEMRVSEGRRGVWTKKRELSGVHHCPWAQAEKAAAEVQRREEALRRAAAKAEETR